MPEKKWVFDTVELSNFLLSEAIFILEKRYRRCGFITWQVFDEVSAGISEYPKLKHIDKLVEDKTFKLVALSLAQRKDFRELIGNLGKGEASCIVLAKEQNIAVVTETGSPARQDVEGIGLSSLKQHPLPRDRRRNRKAGCLAR